MKKRIARILAFMLALLTTAVPLTACQGGHMSENTAATDALSTEALPIETETKDPGAFDNTLLLAADGQTTYTIIIPDYAAEWEITAAERLVKTFSDFGVEVTPVVDTATEVTAREIVVGYTNRNAELADDFYEVGTLGYHISAVNEKLFIGANTEAGMTAALERLASDLVSDGNRLSIKEGYVCKTTGDIDAEDIPVLNGAYAESIAYANQVANSVQGYYTDGTRGAFLMTNQTMTIINDMATGGNRQVSSMVNKYGIPYLRNTMSAYVEANGGRYYSADSTESGRMNIFLYGAYHYETHIHGHNFGNASTIDESVEPIDMLTSIRNFTGHNASATFDEKTGSVTITVESTDDPFIKVGKTYSIPADQYNAISITMKTEVATSAQIYLAAGSHNKIDGSQMASFNVTPGEEKTYLVPLDNVTGYEGTLRSIRLDVGAKKGEQIVITSVKAVKVQPSTIPAIGVDRVLYTYPDKLHSAMHLVTTDTVEGMTAYGMVTSLDKSRVKSLLVIDGKGEHTSLENVDWNTAVAVAFDIDRAGVFGYILTLDDSAGNFVVTEKDGMYIIDQKAVAKTSYKELEDIYLSQRLYNDTTHDFDGFRNAVREERNPLTLTVTSTEFGAVSLGYDALRGAYRMDLDGPTNFSESFYKTPDLHYRVDAEIVGDDFNRNIYLYTHTIAQTIECAVLLDNQNHVLPYMMQVCKNFQGENEEPIYDYGDSAYGEVFFPLVVNESEKLAFSVLNLYQNWGVFSLKQISSIQFQAPYYHLSTGATETNCIAPFYVTGKDRWTLPDFRAMSAPMWSTQPQHTSAGRLYFLEYTDAEGNTYASESTVDEIVSHGPVYADIWMDYLSDDGRIEISYRHLEMPQMDENRTYYEIHMKILEDITFENFKEDFTIFAMDGRSVTYERFAYLDENNQPVIGKASSEFKESFIKLGNQSPFISYSYSPSSDNYVNMALIIKDSTIIIGGETYTGGFLASDVRDGKLNRARLTLNLDQVTLKAGDEININLILLPWGSQYTPSERINSVLSVRDDTCLNPIKTDVKVGSLLADPYMPQIQADKQNAEFTLSGSYSNIAVRVYGFNDYAKPLIEEYVNGAWVTYETASSNGYDGYMVYYDGDGTYSFSFVVDMSEEEPRTFRVKQ